MRAALGVAVLALAFALPAGAAAQLGLPAASDPLAAVPETPALPPPVVDVVDVAAQVSTPLAEAVVPVVEPASEPLAPEVIAEPRRVVSLAPVEKPDKLSPEQREHIAPVDPETTIRSVTGAVSEPPAGIAGSELPAELRSAVGNLVAAPLAAARDALPGALAPPVQDLLAAILALPTVTTDAIAAIVSELDGAGAAQGPPVVALSGPPAGATMAGAEAAPSTSAASLASQTTPLVRGCPLCGAAIASPPSRADGEATAPAGAAETWPLDLAGPPLDAARGAAGGDPLSGGAGQPGLDGGATASAVSPSTALLGLAALSAALAVAFAGFRRRFLVAAVPRPLLLSLLERPG